MQATREQPERAGEGETAGPVVVAARVPCRADLPRAHVDRQRRPLVQIGEEEAARVVDRVPFRRAARLDAAAHPRVRRVGHVDEGERGRVRRGDPHLRRRRDVHQPIGRRSQADALAEAERARVHRAHLARRLVTDVDDALAERGRRRAGLHLASAPLAFPRAESGDGAHRARAHVEHLERAGARNRQVHPPRCAVGDQVVERQGRDHAGDDHARPRGRSSTRSSGRCATDQSGEREREEARAKRDHRHVSYPGLPNDTRTTQKP